MIKLSIREARTRLSKYLLRLKQGEVIVLCRRNTPIAEIRPGSFAPLPADELAAFEGEEA